MRNVKEITQSARKWICAFPLKRKKELIVLKEMKRQNKVGLLPNFLDEILRTTAFVYDLKEDGTLEAFSVSLTEFVSVLRVMKKTEKAAAFLQENKLLQKAARTRSFPVFKEALDVAVQLTHELAQKKNGSSFLNDLIMQEDALLLRMLVEKQASPVCLHLNENKKHLVRRNKVVPIFPQILEGIQRQKEEKDFPKKTFKSLVTEMNRPSFYKQIFNQPTGYGALVQVAGELKCYRNIDKLKQLSALVRKAGGVALQQDFLTKADALSDRLRRKGEDCLAPCPIPSLVEQQTNKICFLGPFDELPPCPRALALLEKMKAHTR